MLLNLKWGAHMKAVREQDAELRKLKKKRYIKENLEAFGFLAPAFIILFIFLFLPVLYAFILSFQKGNPLMGFEWFGIRQYSYLLTQDMDFYRALVNTIYYTAFTIPLQIIIGIAFALLLNRAIKGIGFFRTVYFIPHITSLVAVALIWNWLFNEQFGLINNFIIDQLGGERLGWFTDPQGIFEKAVILVPRWVEQIPVLNIVAPPLQWLEEGYLAFVQRAGDYQYPLWHRVLAYAARGPSLALLMIISLTVWKLIGFSVLIFLAGLQNINTSYYEAAKIYGASRWQQFRHVTWPLLSPTTFFILVVGLINSFKVFVPMMMMTFGGPENTTQSVVYYLYEEAWVHNKMGRASAIAYILFVIILVITLIQNKIVGKRVHYDS